MVKSRQRKQSELIIRSKKSWFDEGVITLISLIGWMYCLLVVYFFISAIFDLNDRFISIVKLSYKMTNHDIRAFLLMGFLLLVIFYISLLLWKQYNAKRFGTLTRRKYPKPTTKEDILALRLMSEENYELVQQSKVAVFEKNPIRDL